MQYMSQFNKSYSSTEEYRLRLDRFTQNDNFIAEVNHPDSGHTHTAGHNKFSDWTEEEYKGLLSESVP